MYNEPFFLFCSTLEINYYIDVIFKEVKIFCTRVLKKNRLHIGRRNLYNVRNSYMISIV